MKRELVALAFIIVLSVSVAAVAVTNKDVLTTAGQSTLSTYQISRTADPNLRFDAIDITQGGTQYHAMAQLQYIKVGDLSIFGADGYYFVYNTITGVWHVEWYIKNDLPIPVTVTPTSTYYGCVLNRAGTEPPSPLVALYAGASQGCPARGPSVDTASSLTSAQPSTADGTHYSTLVQMSFLGVSTMNLANSSTPSSTTSNVSANGVPAWNKYLSLHAEAKLVKPAANPTQLRFSICAVDTPICSINGHTVTIPAGQTAVVTSTVDSTNSACALSPLTVNHALININVQAGGSTYKAYGADELIVFGQKEATLFGSS